MCTDIHRNQTLTVVCGQEMNRMSRKTFVFQNILFIVYKAIEHLMLPYCYTFVTLVLQIQQEVSHLKF